MTATIALAGDTMLGRGVADALVHDRATPLVAPEVVDQLARADAVVLNLECCISDRGTPFPDPRKRFFFRAPPVAAARLAELEADPPGIYAEIAAEPDPEEALWLAFLTAYLSPTESADPFAAIAAAHVPWASGELPNLDVALGFRTSRESSAAERTVLAYRAWAQRAGSQQAAFVGEAAWTPERRFDRVFERLALPGFGRPGRYELLVSLGRLAAVDVRPSSLQLTDDATTVAAKRVFGIGDKMLLERRARDLADAAELPIEALDLALFNWAAPPAGRVTYGSRAGVDDGEREAIAGVLGV
jgi:hypothetical protein